jgi:hypothetical protein
MDRKIAGRIADERRLASTLGKGRFEVKRCEQKPIIEGFLQQWRSIFAIGRISMASWLPTALTAQNSNAFYVH